MASGEQVQSLITRQDCHIAVVPSMGLGDSLIYVLLATNLARAGFRVTMLSNHLANFADWLPHIEMLPFPMHERTEELFDSYDLVVADGGSIISRMLKESKAFAEQFVFIGTLKVKQEYVLDLRQRLIARLGTDKAALLRELAVSAGPIRVIPDDSVTMVAQTVEFCRSRLGLGQASADVGFSLPATLTSRRHHNRVMLHPTSYNAKKNWPWQKYLQLARRLQKRGYEPQFVLSPKERAVWAPYFETEFAVPQFANSKELAAHLYESGFVIGNDSGVGHLASALGVPVLTLYRKRRDGFCWRPGWGDNEVVRPSISLGSFRGGWKFFLSVSKVERAFDRLSSRHGVRS